MSSQNNLVNSLIDYVKDIKPYHVKLRDFISELQFLDFWLGAASVRTDGGVLHDYDTVRLIY